MRSFILSFKNRNKKTFLTVLSAGLLAAVVVVGTVSADGPQFNIFPIAYDGSMNTDYPLLDARNVTKAESWSTSQADHDAGINADPGDVVEFLVYYHNGAPDAPENIARNTVVQASVPGASGNLFTIGGTISADNAATVSSTSKGGDMVVRVSGSLGQSLSLISGTTVWMPDRGTRQQLMPDTITSGGINIGDIRGCWDFTGFVKFRVRVSENLPVFDLSIAKDVRKVGTSDFTDSVDANPGETVEFRIVGNNTGTGAITHVFFSDALPSRLTFVPGTLSVSQPPLSGNLFTAGGLDVGLVNPGASVTVKFQAQVAAASQFPIGTTTLVNTASVWGQGPTVSVRSDTASVVVTIAPPEVCTVMARATLNGSPWSGSLTYTIAGPANISGTLVPADFANRPVGTYTPNAPTAGGPASATYAGVDPTSDFCPSGGSVTFTYRYTFTPTLDLSIDKQVRNITTGSAFGDSVDALPAQTVEFKIVIRNTGNATLNEVVARDVLPDKMDYIADTLTIDGVAYGCPFCFFTTSGGAALGSMVVSQTKTIIFRTQLRGPSEFPVGSTTLVNTAYARAINQVSEKSDTATVVVNKTAPTKPNGTPGTRP